MTIIPTAEHQVHFQIVDFVGSAQDWAIANQISQAMAAGRTVRVTLPPAKLPRETVEAVLKQVAIGFGYAWKLEDAATMVLFPGQ